MNGWKSKKEVRESRRGEGDRFARVLEKKRLYDGGDKALRKQKQAGLFEKGTRNGVLEKQGGSSVETRRMQGPCHEKKCQERNSHTEKRPHGQPNVALSY